MIEKYLNELHESVNNTIVISDIKLTAISIIIGIKMHFHFPVKRIWLIFSKLAHTLFYPDASAIAPIYFLHRQPRIFI
jgi:hypothetical protein